MDRWRRWIVVGVLALGCLPGVARAESEVDILLDKLVEKGVLTGVEAGLIRREVKETKEERDKQIAKDIVPDAARNWKWKGDLRLRDEIRNRVGTGNDDHRQRIRFRFGAEVKVNDQMKATFRLATGSDNGLNSDPISTNKTFDDFFRKKPINLDLANIEWTPEVPGVTKTTLIGGMMENPMWTVGPMVWDPDLSFDGAAIKLSQDLGPMATVFTNDGVFSLDSDETEAAALWTAQAGAVLKPFPDSEEEVLKNLKVTGAIAYDDYMNVTTAAKAGTDPITRVNTNTSTVGDFNLVNPSLEIASQAAGYPMSFFTDWVHNTGAADKVNDGYMFGAKIGKAATPWSLKSGWEAGYFFERLEADAAFDEFVDSDFIGGGTNRRGNVFWLNLQILKNSQVGAKFFTGQQIRGAKANEDRVQLDWVTKF